jgi:hypothetical protein
MPRVEDAMRRQQHPDPTITEIRNNRVTAKDFWHLPGSATGEEAMAMAKKKAQERQLKEAAVEERRADRESKKRREVTDAIKRSEALLLEISSQGPSRLSTMVLKDLKALLLHAHPDGSADSKGTKAELQGRIALLPDVVQALQAFSSRQQAGWSQPHPSVDLPTVSAPMPPPPPPPTAQAPHVPPEMFETLLASDLHPSNLFASSYVAPF